MPATLPDVSALGARPIPQSTRTIQGYTAGVAEKAAGELGDTITKVGLEADKLQYQQEKEQGGIQSAYAKSSLLQKQIEIEGGFEKDQNYTTYGQRYTDQMNDARDTAAKMITNPIERDKFLADAQLSIAHGSERVSDMARNKEKDYGVSSLNDLLDKNRSSLLNSQDEGTRASMLAASQQAIAGAAQRGYISQNQAQDARQKFVTDYSLSRAAMLPAAEQLKALKPDGVKIPLPAVSQSDIPTGQTQIVDYVIHQFEGGGKLVSHGNGQYTRYGIYSVANPDVNVRGLTEDGAKQLYKERYWNVIDADNLPENMKLVAFDTAANFGVSEARKLLAQSGNDPAKLVELRTAEHQRLMADNPKKYGSYRSAWESRDAKLAEIVGGTTADAGPVSFPKTNDWRDFLPPDKRVELINKAQKVVDNENFVQSELAKVDQAGRGGVPLDPKNKDDKDALDLHYRSTSSNWASLPLDQQVKNTVDYVAQKSMVPDTVQGMVRGALRAGDPSKVVMASSMLRQFSNSNPQLLNDFSTEDIRMANLVGEYTDTGMQPKQAVEKATQFLQVPESARAERLKDYDAVVGKDPKKADAAFISGKLGGGWFSGTPGSIPPQMVDEFSRTARTEFMATGNLAASQATALDEITKVWGQSRVAGDNRYMRYAPEKVYGIPGKSLQENADWINGQLLEDLNYNAFKDPKNPITLDRVIVAPLERSMSADGLVPYQVWLKSKDGVLNPVLNTKGQPMQWKPSWQDSKEYMKQLDDQKKSIQEAHRARQESIPVTKDVRAPLGIYN